MYLRYHLDCVCVYGGCSGAVEPYSYCGEILSGVVGAFIGYVKPAACFTADIAHRARIDTSLPAPPTPCLSLCCTSIYLYLSIYLIIFIWFISSIYLSNHFHLIYLIKAFFFSFAKQDETCQSLELNNPTVYLWALLMFTRLLLRAPCSLQIRVFMAPEQIGPCRLGAQVYRLNVHQWDIRDLTAAWSFSACNFR